ncbi:ABC transporter ATP-binding protein [Falsigemmobacter faecalis]|uniref:ATP-binding cassette domain-containing protein n=1 Tax=Falsigemmobacter faecalis TaxID=2488730 RepID=A0A3P3D1T3_9RHOB|nr:oligopeptide/dipeptide ABC transporter ATP-binding protein [Falsigemmobacter faecalis]RRH68373.1 ATP-binding cassette domain-containing protein [Falsigemmobacter faecalis]
MTAVVADPPVIAVRNLTLHFQTGSFLSAYRSPPVRAVEDVSLTLRRGETLSIVGESGCGKTTLGRMIMRLLRPTAGTVELNGRDITALKGKHLRALRQDIQMIFQDPFSSLNPRMTVGDTIAEPLVIKGVREPQLSARVSEMLGMVGLSEAHKARFPHALSGGQRQRVGIARALILEPEVVVCDEAVSALDVSVQAQILNLMQDLQQILGLTYLFISHDLAVVRHISDRVGVMYLGRLVEIADKEQLFSSPAHPYSRALMAAVPVSHPSLRRPVTPLEGNVPSPRNPPPGCAFHTRCPLARSMGNPAQCHTAVPALRDIGPAQQAACHFA